MSSNGPAFQLYSADFFMDTNHWTIEEIGIYTRLLLTEWVQGGLPPEVNRLARIAGCSSKKFQKWWGTISFKFTQNGNGKLINLRLEEEREKQRKYREIQIQKGKAGAEKRWGDGIAGAIAQPIDKLQPNDSSSSSSSSSYKDIEVQSPPESSALLSDEDIQILEETDDLGKKLWESKKFPKINAFLNWCIKENYHLKAIHHTLKQIANNDVRGQPWAYGVKVIKIESQNFTEQDHFKKHAQLKKEEAQE